VRICSDGKDKAQIGSEVLYIYSPTALNIFRLTDNREVVPSL